MNSAKQCCRLLALKAKSTRPVSTTSATLNTEGGDNKGFFGSFFERKIETQQAAHSAKLASVKEEIIEVQTHNVKPDSIEEYLEAHRNLVNYINSNKIDLHCEALGNFRVFVGDEDQHIHLWRYDDGYHGIDKTLAQMRSDPEFVKIRNTIVPLLRNRHSQYLLPFSFWPQPYPRKNEHIYELRSYHLRPGTMVEWGNYWARAISMRDHKHSEAYIGLFSQVGELYNVKHIWCYDSLEDRKQARENVWQQQQGNWSDIVAKTVPLIRHMTSRIMEPLDYSETK